MNRSTTVSTTDGQTATYYAAIPCAPTDEAPQLTIWRKSQDGPSVFVGDLAGEPSAELTKAGWILESEWVRVGDHHEVVILAPVLDCPAWCNDHAINGPNVAEYGEHVHTANDRVEVVDDPERGIVVNIGHPSEPDTFYALTADHLRTLRDDVDSALVALEVVR